MKKSKEEIAKKIQERDQIRAEALLKMPAYRQAIKEYEDIQRQTAKIKQYSKNKELCLKEIRKCNEICDKFSLPFLYPLDVLKAIADSKTFFIGGELEEVDITQAQPDQEGFLHFKIKAGAPRYIIHYLLDLLLDTYEPQREKERFRIGKLNPLEIRYKYQVEGKTLSQIAKDYYEADYGKLKKGETPAYNPELKNIYEQVKRAYKSTYPKNK